MNTVSNPKRTKHKLGCWKAWYWECLNFRQVKFYSHQLMHFFIQLCISLLSYIKIT